MNLYSLGFLFVFLPLGSLTYYFLRGRARSIFLLGLSLLFVGLLSPLFLLLMVLAVAIDFWLAKPIAYAHPKAKAIFAFCAVKDILLFVVTSSLSQLHMLALPLSISIVSFTSIGYLADLYHGETDLVEDPVAYGLYCCFFGKLYVGPIVSANDFIPQVASAHMTPESVTRGMPQFILGLAKKVVLADPLMELIGCWEGLLDSGFTVLGAWMRVITFIFYIYFTLSGFSDMARGIGAIFGYSLPENFRHPLQASSIAEFFSRFNISANRFVRKYVYQALGAEDNGRLSTAVNIMLITMLMGVWYGIDLNYLVWGAFLGIFIVFEVLYLDQHAERIPPYLSRIYTFIAILISFCWFSGRNIGDSWYSLQAMFGIGRLPFLNEGCIYLLQSHWLLLLLSAFFCTGMAAPLFGRFCKKYPTAGHICSLLLTLGLLITSLAFMV